MDDVESGTRDVRVHHDATLEYATVLQQDTPQQSVGECWIVFPPKLQFAIQSSYQCDAYKRAASCHPALTSHGRVVVARWRVVLHVTDPEQAHIYLKQRAKDMIQQWVALPSAHSKQCCAANRHRTLRRAVLVTKEPWIYACIGFLAGFSIGLMGGICMYPPMRKATWVDTTNPHNGYPARFTTSAMAHGRSGYMQCTFTFTEWNRLISPTLLDRMRRDVDDAFSHKSDDAVETLRKEWTHRNMDDVTCVISDTYAPDTIQYHPLVLQHWQGIVFGSFFLGGITAVLILGTALVLLKGIPLRLTFPPCDDPGTVVVRAWTPPGMTIWDAQYEWIKKGRIKQYGSDGSVEPVNFKKR